MTIEDTQNSHVKKKKGKTKNATGRPTVPGVSTDRAGCHGTHFNAGMSIATKSIILLYLSR